VHTILGHPFVARNENLSMIEVDCWWLHFVQYVVKDRCDRCPSCNYLRWRISELVLSCVPFVYPTNVGVGSDEDKGHGDHFVVVRTCHLILICLV